MEQNYESDIKGNILVVDDQSANLKFLTEILKHEGYQVRIALDGKTALSSVDLAAPDLILLDILMPEIDGYETCRRLKQKESLKNIPIIFISALSDSFDKIKAFKTGGVDYVTKPFEPEELLTRVNTHLSRKIMMEKLEQQNIELEKEINQRKISEEELKKYQNYLEKLVKDRTSDLITSNENLKAEINERKQIESELIQSEKLSALGELSASLVHELSQPLFSIQLLAQILIKNIDSNQLEIENLQIDLNEIVTQIKKMDEIMHHMKSFSHKSDNDLTEAVSINKVIEGPLKVCQKQLAHQNIEVKLQLNPELPQVKGNSNRLEQVLLNLINNARHALDDCQKKDKTIEIKSYHNMNKDLNYVVLEVKDNANGIPENAKEKLFQSFFTTKAPGKGTGLGLSISNKIIADHEGKIEVESEVGKGALFRIILPVIESVIG